MLHLIDQGGVHRLTGGIGAVNNTAMAVTALFGEVIIAIGVFFGEVNPLVDQPLNCRFAVFDRKTHGVFVAQAGAGNQRVGNMGVNRILIVKYRGNPALGIPGRPLVNSIFAKHSYARILREA